MKRRLASQVGSRTPRSHNALQKVIDKAVSPGRLDLVPVLLRAAGGVWRREVSPQQGTSIAALIGQAIKAHMVSELEDRIAALERLQPSDVVISEVPVWTGPSELVMVPDVPSPEPTEGDEETDAT
jgi:hypothetical protein